MGFVQRYLQPIGGGVLVFVALALVLVVPYVVVQYRRRGRVGARRTLVEASFLLYLLVAWALVLLPLPTTSAALCADGGAAVNLQPFAWVRDVRNEWAYDGGTLRDLAGNSALWVRVLNLVLLLPLGVYLRRWWRRGFWTTVVAALLLSVLFELTQTTGIWGLYPCAYRSFDVDDLVANTAGAALGWWIAPVVFLLPRRRDDDDRVPLDQRPSVPRRALADAADLLVALVVALPLVLAVGVLASGWSWPAQQVSDVAAMVALAVVLVAVPWAARGSTPGKALLRLRIARADGARAGVARLLLRAVALWGPWVLWIWVVRGVSWPAFDAASAAWQLLVAWGPPLAWALVVSLTVAARADRRGPHDLVARTQVEVRLRRRRSDAVGAPGGTDPSGATDPATPHPPSATE
ncbi:MAG: VanZ family protein [Candidatus Nanopelagicales bacterium]